MNVRQFFIGVGIVVMLVSCMVTVHAYRECCPPSEAEICEAYVINEFGEGDYEIELYEDFESEFGLTYFTAYENGETVFVGGINCEHCSYLAEWHLLFPFAFTRDLLFLL